MKYDAIFPPREFTLVYPLYTLRCVFLSLISLWRHKLCRLRGCVKLETLYLFCCESCSIKLNIRSPRTVPAHRIIQYMCVITDNYPLYFSAHLNANGTVDNDKEATGESVGRFLFLNPLCVYAKQQPKQTRKCDKLIRHKSVGSNAVAKRSRVCARAPFMRKKFISLKCKSN